MTGNAAKNRWLMIGPDFSGKGGIATVAAAYRDAGLFGDGSVVFRATFVEGGKLLKLRLALSSFLYCLRLLLTGKLAGLHVHMATQASFWRKAAFAVLVVVCGKPLVLHLHSGKMPAYYQQQLGRFGQNLFRWLLRKATRVLVLTPEWLEWVQSVEPACRAQVLFNPVLIPELDSTPREPASILFLGRMDENKGVRLLLQAMVPLLAKYPDLLVRIGGDGDWPAIEAFAQSLGLAGHVQYLGWVVGEDKRRLLACSTLYALPSYKEGLPMGVLEAMACGLPVVATSVGGIPSVRENGQHGLLIEPGSVAQLSAALDRLLADPALRLRMATAARIRVSALCSAHGVVQDLTAVYREAEGL